MSLFTKFFSIMTKDCVFMYRIPGYNANVQNPILLACIGKDISLHLTAANQSWEDFDLPEFEPSCIPIDIESNTITDKKSYDHHLLNSNQYAIFSEIVNALENETNKTQILFYIDGPGGTGKTYLSNTILYYAKTHHLTALAVASTGLASMLLIEGRTAHSQFEIPLELTKESTCNIPKQSKLSKQLQMVDLILWDEAPMMHRYAFEALDRTLQDIKGNKLVMGGIITVLCGDFRQILPIIPRGSRVDIVHATLKESYLWKHIKSLKLYENMRLTESSKQWHGFLLSMCR